MVKSTKEQIKSEQTVFDSHRKEVDIIEEQMTNVMNKLNLLYVKLILEEGVINEIKWSVNIYVSNGRLSSFILKGDVDKAATITEILKPNYHSSFEMEPGVRLIFDDSDMSISFSDLQTGLSFILKYNINIDTKPITGLLSSLQNSIDSIKKFEDQLKAK